MSYEDFAYYYDSLMDPSFYDDYEKFIGEHCFSFSNVLELGCGTGEIAIRLSKKNKEVYATDLSDDMLEVARIKAMNENVNLMLKRVDMSDFSTNVGVDLILCLCDSINYLLDIDDVFKTFFNVYKSLNDNGCFIFDIDSLYKTDVILKDYLEEESDDEFSFFWKVDLIKSGYVHHLVKIEDKENNEHVEENHYQRTYDHQIYIELLKRAGFDHIELYSDFEDFHEQCERIIFVCYKGE